MVLAFKTLYIQGHMPGMEVFCVLAYVPECPKCEYHSVEHPAAVYLGLSGGCPVPPGA